MIWACAIEKPTLISAKLMLLYCTVASLFSILVTKSWSHVKSKEAKGTHQIGMKCLCWLLKRQTIEGLSSKMENKIWFQLLDQPEHAPGIGQFRDDHLCSWLKRSYIPQIASWTHDSVHLVSTIQKCFSHVTSQHARDASDQRNFSLATCFLGANFHQISNVNDINTSALRWCPVRICVAYPQSSMLYIPN